jgi:peptidylamidoglycolate lyase
MMVVNHAKRCWGKKRVGYRAHRSWGRSDHSRYPVKDCHAITEDRNNRIVMLTNDTHNNLLAYSKAGKLINAWKNRFPAFHGLEIIDTHGEGRYWITDHNRQVVSVCTAEGKQLLRVEL